MILNISTSKTQIIYDKHKICSRYMIYIKAISSNILRVNYYTYTDFDLKQVPKNVTYDYDKKMINWMYEIEDCLPRSFYVFFCVKD